MENRVPFFALSMLFWSQAGLAQESLLSRSDQNRSQFAGSNMKRVQSYGQPAPGGNVGLLGETEAGAANISPEGSGRPGRQGRVVTAPPAVQSGFEFPVGGVPGGKTGASSELPQMQPKAYRNVSVQAVYLNGVNVVGLRNQSMKGVNVRFDENGNVFIDAPQYEVQYDTSYHPLLPDELPGFEKQQAPLPAGALSSGSAPAPAPVDGLPQSSKLAPKK